MQVHDMTAVILKISQFLDRRAAFRDSDHGKGKTRYAKHTSMPITLIVATRGLETVRPSQCVAKVCPAIEFTRV